ncbi:hypothetical protein BCR44DRAFT_1275868 [Catenaria anguillulae PL171]|uniref:Rad21/Rec8-like protein C-terminal eukaryotic domain-containing protein n=1 Tax=Catenaria anguillulae PL171 TaxID=765915 RepID=A0A1Y2H9H6_9FUNG|nr:hypothetical protein BCR44DRAFT_1275868 [Catenaria anguillulae PL171]
MGPGLMSDISSMASRPEPQLLFPPSPMLEPMREMTEEPADISTAQYASAMQQQSFNFYQRTKVLLEASATGELVFDDMLPARTRVVAAQAFYHLLTLATQRKLKVHQEAPYEAITVMGVEEEEERETMEEL